MNQGRLVPWLYLGPALIIMSVYIAPNFHTIVLNFTDQTGAKLVTTGCRPGTICVE